MLRNGGSVKCGREVREMTRSQEVKLAHLPCGPVSSSVRSKAAAKGLRKRTPVRKVASAAPTLHSWPPVAFKQPVSKAELDSGVIGAYEPLELAVS